MASLSVTLVSFCFEFALAKDCSRYISFFTASPVQPESLFGVPGLFIEARAHIQLLSCVDVPETGVAPYVTSVMSFFFEVVCMFHLAVVDLGSTLLN